MLASLKPVPQIFCKVANSQWTNRQADNTNRQILPKILPLFPKETISFHSQDFVIVIIVIVKKCAYERSYTLRCTEACLACLYISYRYTIQMSDHSEPYIIKDGKVLTDNLTYNTYMYIWREGNCSKGCNEHDVYYVMLDHQIFLLFREGI